MGSRVAAKDGKLPAYAGAGSQALINMESLGIPRSLQLLLLSQDVAELADPCIRSHQDARIPSWRQEYESKGRVYDQAETYRFRSWFHSAMHCWLVAGRPSPAAS